MTTPPAANPSQTPAPGSKGLFFIVDGSNVYCSGENNKRKIIDGPNIDRNTGKQKIGPNGELLNYWRPPFPRLDVIESFVVFCIENQHPFKVFFDSPTPHQFRNTQQKNNQNYPDILPRFDSLNALKSKDGEECCQYITKNQADPLILHQASERIKEGYDVYILSDDMFNKKEDDFDRRFQNVVQPRGRSGHPLRNLIFNYSATKNKKSIVFESFPSVSNGGEIEISASLDLNTLKKIYRSYSKGETFSSRAEIPPIVQTPPHTATPAPVQPAVKAVDLPKDKVVKAAILNTELEVSPLRLTGNPSELMLSDYGRLNYVADAGARWPITVGRDDTPNSNGISKLQRDLLINSKLEFVSGKHLEFDYDSDTETVYVTDTSTNGSWLGNMKLVANQKTPLTEPHGVIRLGGHLDQGGVVNMFYHLDNLEVIDDTEDTGRRFTVLRPSTRVPTQLRPSGATPTGAPAGTNPPVSVMPVAPWAKSQQAKKPSLLLHYKYHANGQSNYCSLENFPFSIGTSIPDFMGLNLPSSLCKGVLPTHLRFDALITDPFDTSGTALSGIKVVCGSDVLLNGVAQQGTFVLNVSDQSTGVFHCLTVANAPASQAVDLWVTRA
jgi:FHA domain